MPTSNALFDDIAHTLSHSFTPEELQQLSQVLLSAPLSVDGQDAEAAARALAIASEQTGCLPSLLAKASEKQPDNPALARLTIQLLASPTPEPAPSTLAADGSHNHLEVAQVLNESAVNPLQYGGVRIGDTATISGIVVGGSVTGDINIYMASSRADALKAAATVISGASGPRPSCPYPGMVPFRPEDARFFYGREGEIEEMVLRLRGQDFLLVIGPSGSGKSSLVFAGLLPKLATSPDWPPNFWRVVTMRPGAEPMGRLAEALGGSAGKDLLDPSMMVKELLMAHPPAQRLLLVVDQFEELFTLANPEHGPGNPQTEHQREREFISALKALRALGSCAVVLTMRADFYHDLMSSALWPVEEGARVEIAPLQGDALCAAIEQPAADVGVEIEDRLLERLLADAEDQPGSLPLLQETLVLLWGRIEGRTLTLAAYERLGRDGRSGLAVAMALKGDSVLASLSPERQEIARRIFLRLTQFGEGRPDTRRQQPVAALMSESDPPALFRQVLATLADNRLLTLSGDEQHATMKVDLAHEALIRDWPTLRNWLAERRGAEQIRRRLESKTEEWVRLGRKSSGLLDEGELAEAEHWLQSQDALELGASADLHSLVAASMAVISAARRRRWLAALAAVLTAVAIAIAAVIVAFDRAETAHTLEIRRQEAVQAQATSEAQEHIAVQAQATAEAQERKARSHALAANAVAQLDIDPERSLILSLEAISVAQEYSEIILPQAEDALRLALAKSHVRQTLSGHTDLVNSVAWSPDGRWIATASDDNTAKVWDAANGQERATLRGHTDLVNSVAWSPDGRWIATASDDNTAKVWDATNGQQLTILLGHTADLTSVAWSPDGRWIATASDDVTAKVWDATNGQERTILRGHVAQVSSVAWSPDGLWLSTGSWDGTAKVWDAATGQEQITLRGYASSVESVAWSPDGRWIAAAYDDGTAKVWDAANGQEQTTLRGHTSLVSSVVWSPDGLWIATAGWDGKAKVWDATNDQERATLRGHTAKVNSVAWSPNGRWIATASSDGTAKVWDAATGQERATLRGHTDLVNSVAWSPDGRWIATASWDGTAKVWDATNGQERATLRGHTGAVASVAWSPDGRWIATASWDSTATVSRDGTATVWNAANGQQRTILLGHRAKVSSVAWSPDGRWIATASWDGTAKVWDATNGQQRATFRGHIGLVNSVAWSPDGRWIATARSDGTAKVWDAATGQEHVTLRGHTDWVNDVAWSPDGRWIATAGDDGTGKVWDAANGQQHATLPGHTGAVASVAWSPDGRWIATASSDGTVRQHVATVEDLLAIAYTRVIRSLTPEERATFLNEPLPTTTPSVLVIPTAENTPSP
ncbi:MAG TPA: hypothetical protein VGE45_14240 [Chloroflexia bacterium]|jgi:WD40 repeat protein/energy-coupling factor transporter ATP-binding protein EcfA2